MFSEQPLASRSASSETTRKWVSLAIICAAQFVYLMDVFLLNVSAPAIRAEFESPAILKGILSANQIAFASLVFLGGRLGDFFGRRRLFVLGLLGAGLSALIAANLNSGASLIAARALQGACYALFIPQVMAILVSLFDEGERARAIGVFGMVIGFGGVAGFLGGGLILEFASDQAGWRSVFLFVSPCLLLLSLLAQLCVPSIAPSHSGPLKILPTLMLLLAAILIIGPVTAGTVLPAKALSLALLSGGGFAILFFWQQRREMRKNDSAMLSTDLINSRRFRAGVLGCFLLFLGNTSFYLTSTLFLSSAFGLSPLSLGLSYLPLGLAFIAGSRVGSAQVYAVGPVAVVRGLIILTLSLLILGVAIATGASSHLLIVALLAPFGYAQGYTMAPLIGLTVGAAKPLESGSASGTQQAAQQFGNAIGLAMLSTVFFFVESRADVQAAMITTLSLLAVASLVTIFAARRMRD